MKVIWRLSPWFLPALCVTGVFFTKYPAISQEIIPAENGTNTQINRSGNQVNIEGGTQSQDGTNLFHDFDKFGVDTGETVIFNSAPEILNILTRITGRDPSIIRGSIQVDGGNSNLFLMNPAGFVLFDGANINVPGDLTLTTSTAIGFGNNLFNAFGDNDYSSLEGDPDSFIFNSDSDEFGTIVNAANLDVPEGNLSLIAANVVNLGNISAGNNIIVTVVPGTSLVRISTPNNLLSLEIEPLRDEEGLVVPFQVLDLPGLLTGTEGSEALGLTVNNGTVQEVSSSRIVSSDQGQFTNLGSNPENLRVITETADIDVMERPNGNSDNEDNGISRRDDSDDNVLDSNISNEDDGNQTPGDTNDDVDNSQDSGDNTTDDTDGGNLANGDNGINDSGNQTPGDTNDNVDNSQDLGDNTTDDTDGGNLANGDNGINDSGNQTPGDTNDNVDNSQDLGDNTTDGGNLADGDNGINDSGNQTPGDTNDNVDNSQDLGDNTTDGGNLADGDNGINDSGNQTPGDTNDNVDNSQDLGDNTTDGGNLADGDNGINDSGNQTPGDTNDNVDNSQDLGDNTTDDTDGGTAGDRDNGINDSGNQTPVDTNDDVDNSQDLGDNTTDDTDGGNLANGDNGINDSGNQTPVDTNDDVDNSQDLGDNTTDDTDGGNLANGDNGINDSGNQTPVDTNDDVDNSQDLGDNTTDDTDGGNLANGDNGINDSGNQTPVDTNDNVDNSQDSGDNNTDDTDGGTAGDRDNGFTDPNIDEEVVNAPQDQVDPLDNDEPPITPDPEPESVNADPSEINPVDLIKPSESATTQIEINIASGSNNSQETSIEDDFDELEARYTNELANYLDRKDQSTPVTLSEAIARLRRIEQKTGVKAALIYAYFVPSPNLSEDQLKSSPSRNSKQNSHSNSANFANECDYSQERENEPTTAQSGCELAILVVTSRGVITPVTPGISKEKLLATVAEMEQSVRDPSKGHTYLVSAQQIYEFLVKPIEDKLEARKIDNLVFIANTDLRSLPLAAIHDGQQFLVEKYSLAMMPSLRSSDTEYKNLQETTVLAMGAEKFANQIPLPGVPIELSLITEQIWQGSTALLNEQFTRNNFKETRGQFSTTDEESQPFGIVHLATHAEFKEGKPNRSYIQWWDSRLGLDELRNFDWGAPPLDLIVLSACRTAVGSYDAKLGFSGLALQAGAKSAMGSLWYVSDVGTLALMSEFYRQLQDSSIRADALRQAQIAMIKGEIKIQEGELVTTQGNIALPETLSTQEVDLSHPYYWSAFTMVGNPW